MRSQLALGLRTLIIGVMLAAAGCTAVPLPTPTGLVAAPAAGDTAPSPGLAAGSSATAVAARFPTATPTTAAPFQPPTPVVSATAAVAAVAPAGVASSTVVPATPSGWTALHSQALYTHLIYPSTWVTREEGLTLVLASSPQGLEEGISAGGAAILVQRYRLNGQYAGTAPEELLRSAASGLTPSGPIEAAHLGGQPAAAGVFTFTVDGKSVSAQVTVAVRGVAGTAVFLISPQAEREWQKATLEQIQASLVFDDPAGPEHPLPAALINTTGALEPSDLPQGWAFATPYQMFLQRRSQAYFTRWLSGIGPGLTAARVEGLQVSVPPAGPGNLSTFLAYPVNQAEAQFYDDLFAKPQQLANALNYEPNELGGGAAISTTFSIVTGFDDLGAAAAAVTVGPEADPWIQRPTVDYVVIRRGAALAFLKYEYAAQDDAEQRLSHGDLLRVAQALDRRLRSLLVEQPDLATPLNSVPAVPDRLLESLGTVPGEMQLPQGYERDDGYRPSFAQERLDKYGWRQVAWAQYRLQPAGSDSASELTRLYVIYPLDEVEMRSFDWLLRSPERTAEYFYEAALLERGLDTPLFYAAGYRAISQTVPSELGDSAGGLTLLWDGMPQEVVLVRRGNALLAATVFHLPDGKPVASAVALAQQLDERVKALQAR